LTKKLGWTPNFKLSAVELMVNKFPGDDFSPDLTNELLQAGEVMNGCKVI
jgi:hypothetical protein